MKEIVGKYIFVEDQGHKKMTDVKYLIKFTTILSRCLVSCLARQKSEKMDNSNLNVRNVAIISGLGG